MVSFLVISENLEKSEIWIKDTISNYQISKFDVTSVEKDGTEKNTIGIEQIRLVQKNLSLRPLQGKTKAVVIKTGELLTLEAQNALLKTLEEPPRDTIIILTASRTEALLPTILSRCTIIDLGFEMPTISAEEKKAYETVISSLQKWGAGYRLKQAELLAKDKQETIIWLKKLIITARGELINSFYSKNNNSDSNTIKYYHVLITSFQKTHTILSTTNVNPRLALENMFLSMQSHIPRV